jgi:hypothetical protein
MPLGIWIAILLYIVERPSYFIKNLVSSSDLHEVARSYLGFEDSKETVSWM